MIINKLTASFGKLENDSLELHDGLNVIYAPNESGKSTWCAFIQAMLYGIDSSERMRNGYIPDKLRYAPWSGAPMEGTMELTADRCDITITRRTKTKNAPMKEFSATYTGTNVPVKGLNASNAGEELTGVSKDVFRRSAFIAQGAVSLSGSPELEKRINAIVSTGEEQTSYSEADERLRQWQRKRRYNRRGLLPELEGRMDETRRKLEEMGGSVQSTEELEARLEETKLRCSQLEIQVNQARKRQRREALDRLGKGRADLQRCSIKHDEAMAELSQIREELRQDGFGLREPEMLEEQVRKDLSEMERLKAGAEQHIKPIWPVLFLILAVASAALYTHFRHWAFIVCAAVFCVGALITLVRFGNFRKNREAMRTQLKKLLKRYGAHNASEIQAALMEHRSLWERMELAEQEERRWRSAFDNARIVQSTLEESALQELDFSEGDSEAAHLSRELTHTRHSIEKLSQQIAAANGRLAAMGDPLVLASSLSCMKDEYELLCDEYDAISLAADVLREANDQMQSRFSPELGRVAASYMSAMTGGRYEDVFINRDFSAKVRTTDDVVAREAEYLSAGTLDLMYLAVRLAVCELALPEGERCPLIIDDALVNLDEKRMEQAMELLRDISRDRQVILFSCREK